jgi:hypothetical protein
MITVEDLGNFFSVYSSSMKHQPSSPLKGHEAGRTPLLPTDVKDWIGQWIEERLTARWSLSYPELQQKLGNKHNCYSKPILCRILFDLKSGMFEL